MKKLVVGVKKKKYKLVQRDGSGNIVPFDLSVQYYVKPNNIKNGMIIT